LVVPAGDPGGPDPGKEFLVYTLETPGGLENQQPKEKKNPTPNSYLEKCTLFLGAKVSHPLPGDVVRRSTFYPTKQHQKYQCEPRSATVMALKSKLTLESQHMKIGQNLHGKSRD
jgi:hypothetical protein